MKSPTAKPEKLRVLYFAGTHGDWGGASRVLFTTLSMLDRSRFEPIVALSQHGPGCEILQRMGIECVIWGSMSEFHSPMQYVKAIIRSLLWLRRKRVDVIHVNRAIDWRPAELVAAYLSRTPIVMHFHTVNTEKAPARRMSSRIVAVSDYVARNSECNGVAVSIIHNAVNTEKFGFGVSVRQELGVADHEVLVTFAGQIRTIKGVDLFIRAAHGVVGDNTKFLIVGECRKGPGMDDAYSEAELRNLIACDSRIVYAGYRLDMPDIYFSSDIIVAPSRWQEPFGLILIEAGAAGKPVVATHVGGIPEVIVDGETGFLVDPDDAAALTEKIQLLANDKSLRDRIGCAAKERVEREFTTKPVRKLESIYEALSRAS